MTELNIKVPEIHCEHCKMSLEGAVGALAGVTQVTVDVPRATIDVTFDEAMVDRGDIVAAIEEQGYEVPA